MQTKVLRKKYGKSVCGFLIFCKNSKNPLKSKKKMPVDNYVENVDDYL